MSVTETPAPVGLHIPRPHADQFTSLAEHLANSLLLRKVGMDLDADAQVQLALAQLRYLAKVETAREQVEAHEMLSRLGLTEEASR